MSEYLIETRRVQPRSLLCKVVICTEEERPRAVQEAIAEVAAYLEEYRVEPFGPAVAIYHSTIAGLMELEVGFPLEYVFPGRGRLRESELPSGAVAWTCHVGPHENLQEAYQAISLWALQTGHDLAGPPWDSYVSDPLQVRDVSRLVTEVYWPLR
ncbi:MAG: hypothetical protein GX604_07210 [Actinobacteria bacterium]|nr:hypothetical protein [Actinomycetota bacterium]